MYLCGDAFERKTPWPLLLLQLLYNGRRLESQHLFPFGCCYFITQMLHGLPIFRCVWLRVLLWACIWKAAMPLEKALVRNSCSQAWVMKCSMLELLLLNILLFKPRQQKYSSTRKLVGHSCPFDLHNFKIYCGIIFCWVFFVYIHSIRNVHNFKRLLKSPVWNLMRGKQSSA